MVKSITLPTKSLIGPKIESISPVNAPITSPIIPPRIFSTKQVVAFKILSIIVLKISPTRSSNPNNTL